MQGSSVGTIRALPLARSRNATHNLGPIEGREKAPGADAPRHRHRPRYCELSAVVEQRNPAAALGHDAGGAVVIGAGFGERVAIQLVGVEEVRLLRRKREDAAERVWYELRVCPLEN